MPSHWVRQSWLRLFGGTIGKNTAIMMGTRVHGLKLLTIGNHCSIGSRCLLDARGALTIEDAVVLADDVQVIAGHHVIDSDDFRIAGAEIRIGHHAYCANRATILTGVFIGAGAVVGPCSMVFDDVESMVVVGGSPAVARGVRNSSLDYWPNFRTLFT